MFKNRSLLRSISSYYVAREYVSEKMLREGKERIVGFSSLNSGTGHVFSLSSQ